MNKILLIAAFVVWVVSPVYGVDVAPRISDREIIEGLGEIKVLRTEMNARFDAMQQQTDAKFAAIDARFDAMQKSTDARFEAMQKQNDTKFASIDARFDAMQREMNARFDGLQKQIDTLVMMVAALIGLMGCMFAFVFWDRQTMLRPTEQKVQAILVGLQEEKAARIAESSKFDKLLAALQQFAKSEGRMAEALRAVHLL